MSKLSTTPKSPADIDRLDVAKQHVASMVQPMIEKVLFDLGNVLLRFDFDRAYKAMAEHGAHVPTLKDESMDALKIEYETGAISNEEMYQRTAVLSGYHGSQEHFEQSWEDIFQENAPMVDFLRSLQTRGIPRYLLSNSNDLHVRHVETAYAVLEPFNDIIFSHQAKAMKPDEMIFEKAIAQFGLEPSKTAYIDDLADNIATGRRLGFQCIHYNPDAHDVAENELRALGLITT
ncbi:HAD family phosphatase [Verrucomicrobiales bacterium]|nr:HAD family phosphatase [Verrucomicrobiales bacterium]MDC0502952.1 HAD family phosphatase [Verrucomicrobiales bacterium]